MKLVELFKEFKGDCNTLIETGTYRGAGVVAALSAGFDNIKSFEADGMLAVNARDKFRGNRRVRVFFGSSHEKGFADMVKNLEHKSVFWLDAHKMGPGGKVPEDYPLKAELEAIGKSEIKHTVLIDDVRLFGRYGVDIDYIKRTLNVTNDDIEYRTLRDRYQNDVMCIRR